MPGGLYLGNGIHIDGAGEIKPGLKVFGHRLVQQRALGVARVVGFGFGARWPARADAVVLGGRRWA